MEFKIVKNGKEIKCEIITVFRDESNDINYIVYTDGTKDENGDYTIGGYSNGGIALENGEKILNDPYGPT